MDSRNGGIESSDSELGEVVKSAGICLCTLSQERNPAEMCII